MIEKFGFFDLDLRALGATTGSRFTVHLVLEAMPADAPVARTVAADYPDTAFLMGSSFKPDDANPNFSVFDTICGATQERQDALFDLLKEPLDLLLVVGARHQGPSQELETGVTVSGPAELIPDDDFFVVKVPANAATAAICVSLCDEHPAPGIAAVAIPAPEPPPIFLDSRWVRANSGGLLISEVSLGQRVLAGQKLGRVIDPVSNVERFILAPVPGRVIGMSQNQAVLPGYAAFHLGTETSEQQAVQEAAAPSAPDPVAEDPEDRPESADVQDGEDYE